MSKALRQSADHFYGLLKMASVICVLAASLVFAVPPTKAAEPPPPDPFGPLVDQLQESLDRSLTGLSRTVRGLQFRFETVCREPQGLFATPGTLTRTPTPAIFNVPKPIDACKNIPGTELVGFVQATSEAAGTLRVTKTATVNVPVSVEAVVLSPITGAPDVSFGYDAIPPTAPLASATAPGDFIASWVKQESPSASMTLNLTMRSPGPELVLTGTVFGSTTRKARIGYRNPVPTTARIFFGSDVLNGVKGKTLRLGAAQATTVAATVDDVSGTNVSRVEANVDKLPAQSPTALCPVGGGLGGESVCVRTEEDPALGKRTTSYNASATAGSVIVKASQRSGTTVNQTANLTLGGVPRMVQVTQLGAESVSVDTLGTGAIGTIQAVLANGQPRPLPAGFAGKAHVHFFDDSRLKSTALTIFGLKTANVSLGDPLKLSAELASAPFVALIDKTRVTRRTLDIGISTLPTRIDDFSFSPSAGTIHYKANSRVPQITVSTLDPGGLFGGAKRLSLRLKGVPSEITAGLGGSTGTAVTFDAKGQILTSLELAASSFLPEFSPPPTLDQDLATFIGNVPTGFGAGSPADGFVLRSLPHRFHFDLFTRLNGVRGANVVVGSAETQCTNALDDDGDGRVNDGCPIFNTPTSLSGAEKEPAQCTNATDDDADGRVNDGCRTLPDPSIAVDVTGDRYFKFNVEKSDADKPNGIFYLRGFLDRIKPAMQIRLEPFPPSGQRIFYSAALSPKLLSLDTNAGNRRNLHAELGNTAGFPPVPKSITICQASDSGCTRLRTNRDANKGSMTFRASERTILNLFDCQVGPATGCTESSAERSVRVTNLRLPRELSEELNVESKGASGHVYLDTTPGCCKTKEELDPILDGLSGFVKLKIPDSPDIEINFPSGFVADDRLAQWSNFGFFKSQSGSIICPPDTKVDLFGVINVIGVSGLCAGTFSLTPNHPTVAPGEVVPFLLDWVHPNNWRELETVELRIRSDDGNVIVSALVDLQKNTVCLQSSQGGAPKRCARVGDGKPLKTPWGTLLVAETKVIGSGPTGRSVTVVLPFAFKRKAAAGTYQVEVAASDAGAFQGFDPAGTITVLTGKPRS